ncbi:MAG: cation:proton antiporter, partial [Anaerolineales bacterium]|nr:cation:proton antiporter [Anaerolineales bacterium]
WGEKSGWMSNDFRKLSSLALILLAYGTAEIAGGNGFIAAFVFGLVSGNVAGKKESKELYEHAEVEVALLMLLTFVLFGAVLLPPALEALSPALLLYAAFSLTLVRMLPVGISLIGVKVRPVTTLFLGWFGPRGIASILYVFVVLEHETLPGLDLIYAAVMVTVLISIYAHGLTAAPASDRYGARMEAMMVRVDIDMMEREEVPEMPLRAGG